MRADRLLSILLLLQVHRRMTARDLSMRLEVSERTIHRDMDALSAAGVPVYAQRGITGGWSLTDGYRTNATGMTETEIRTLFLGTPSRVLSDLGLDNASEAALIKLLAALPSASQGGAEDVRQKIHIDIGGWHASDDQVHLLPVLQDAVWRERRLAITYQPASGEPRAREVDPLGLVAKGSVWYLVARAEGDLRTYRADRVIDARLLDEPVNRPDDFDLASFWEGSKSDFVAQLPRYHAVVRVDPAIVRRLTFVSRYSRIESIAEPDDDGWVRVEMRFQFPEDAREFVLGFGPKIEVVQPDDLRTDVIALARAVVETYDS
jgi:predicted DNA-binding transcriptional regulator YafY